MVHRLVQRSDDTEEKAVNRLRTYHSNVDAVVGYYRDQLVQVSEGDCGRKQSPHVGRAGRGRRALGSFDGGQPAQVVCACVRQAWARLIQTSPAACRSRLAVQIDGTKSMDEVFTSIQAAIDGASKAVAA